jgi:hypothetical protein
MVQLVDTAMRPSTSSSWTADDLVNKLGSDRFGVFVPGASYINMAHVVVSYRPFPSDDQRVQEYSFQQLRVFVDPKIRAVDARGANLWSPWWIVAPDDVGGVAAAVTALAKRVVDCMRVAICAPKVADRLNGVTGASNNAPPSQQTRKLFSVLWNDSCAMLANPYKRRVAFYPENGVPKGSNTTLRFLGPAQVQGSTDLIVHISRSASSQTTQPTLVINSNPDTRFGRAGVGVRAADASQAVALGFSSLDALLQKEQRWPDNSMPKSDSDPTTQLYKTLARYPGGTDKLIERIKNQ